jgi:hypothetical protein
LVVHGNANDAIAAEAQQPEGLEDADVHLLADHHRDRRGAEQPIG